jgi:uncharacterized membrane protein
MAMGVCVASEPTPTEPSPRPLPAPTGWADDLVAGIDSFLPNYWLPIANVAGAVFVALPVAAPILEASGYSELAHTIYSAYSYTCHQLPERSWFIFGQQMAFCQRDLAMYMAILAAGIAYGATGRSRAGISLRLYLVLAGPMAIDGTTQLFGLRESDGLLRTITGLLFGWSSVWMIYPFIQRGMDGLKY